jgi:hypothetical protein
MTAAVRAVHLPRRFEVEINDRMTERAAITSDCGSIDGKGFAGLHHASMVRGWTGDAGLVDRPASRMIPIAAPLSTAGA